MADWNQETYQLHSVDTFDAFAVVEHSQSHAGQKWQQGESVSGDTVHVAVVDLDLQLYHSVVHFRPDSGTRDEVQRPAHGALSVRNSPARL